MRDSAIYRVLTHYFPDWEPPSDRRTWNSCLCPNHNEDRPSAAVSYELDAVSCKACGFKGSAVSIIMKKEGLSYEAAEQRAARISVGSGDAIPKPPTRKSRRRVFEL